MNPERIVAGLEWAKKLKEARFPQENVYLFWTIYTDPVMNKTHDPFLMSSNRDGTCPVTTPSGTHELFAAPSAEELLPQIPNWIAEKGKLEIGRLNEGMWFVWYKPGPAALASSQPSGNFKCERTLSDASAAMYCYLVEHNLLPKA